MHLLGPAYTTNNTRKAKVKITKAKLAKWELDLKSYNKLMKSCKAQTLTLDQYIDMIHGRSKIKTQFKPLVVKESEHARLAREHREKYPSMGTFTGNTFKKENQKYTGTLIKGIATMHKSNAVPIIDQKQAEEIAQMRRN
jgi:hypothetical protein